MGIVILVVVCLVFLVLTQSSPIDVKNLKHVEVIQTIDLYKTGYENSGFSIGKSGMRSYYRKKKRFVGTDIKFRVTYITGKTATITAREGSERCNVLLNFIENQDRLIVEQPAPKPIVPAQPIISEPKPKEQHPVEEKTQLVAALSAVAESRKAEGLSTSNTKTPPPKAAPPQKQAVYSAGEYKVGVTIPAGEYAIYSKKKGGSYYEVNRKQNIVFNGFAKGVQLIELCDGDYFEFSDATVQPMENLDLMGMNLPSCSLKVGVHIPPGEYLLTSLNGKSNPMSIYSSCRLTDKNMITFEYVKGNKFVTLKKGNVITYENCRIELVDDQLTNETNSTQEPEQYTDAEDDFFVQIQEEQQAKKTEKSDKFLDGYYTVGEDIPEGEYVIISDSAKETTIKVTPKRHKKGRLTFAFSGSCLLTLLHGEEFEIRNGYAVAIDKATEIPKDCVSYMLKVGVHVPPGNYLLKQANNTRFAVYYILPDSMMNLDQAVDSDAVFGTEEIVLENGQYVYLENAVLEHIN